MATTATTLQATTAMAATRLRSASRRSSSRRRCWARRMASLLRAVPVFCPVRALSVFPVSRLTEVLPPPAFATRWAVLRGRRFSIPRRGRVASSRTLW